MSFFSLRNFIKTASKFMDRIRSIGAKDSAIKLFIKTREPLIKWKGFESEELQEDGTTKATEQKINDEKNFNKYVTTCLLPILQSRIERKKDNNSYLNETNYYLKKIDVEEEYKEVMNGGLFAPIVEEAYKIYNKAVLPNEDPSVHKRAAEIMLLSYYNDMKQDAYDAWWEYTEREQYIKSRPALRYLILENVFSSSDETKKNPVAPVNHAVVEQLVNKIDNIKWDYTGKIKDEGARKKIVGAYKSIIKDNTQLEEKKDISSVVSAAKTLVPDSDSDEIIQIIKTQQVIEAFNNKIEIDNPNYDPTNRDIRVPQKIKAYKTAVQLAEELNTRLPGLSFSPQECSKILSDHFSQDIDIYKYYSKAHIDYCNRLNERFGAGEENNWVHFPRFGYDADGNELVNKDGSKFTLEQLENVYQQRMEELEAYAIPNSWCTTRTGAGKDYLRNGDFWVYKDRGRARVAIRFYGNDILEIAGDQSTYRGAQRTAPVDYWRETIDFIRGKGWENRIVGDSAKVHWNILLENENLLKSFYNKDGTINMDEVNSYADNIRTQPKLYKVVEKNDQVKNNPVLLNAFRKACKEGWVATIASKSKLEKLQFANSILNMSQDIPEFLLQDTDFIRIIHGNLATLYENSPAQIRVVLEKVPQHLEIYPEGKTIFKNAVIREYEDGMFWIATAHGYNKKSKEEQLRIDSSSKNLATILDIIERFLPELQEDVEFQSRLNTAKTMSLGQALNNGFISEDMPKELVEHHLTENIDAFTESIAKKIATAHKSKYSRQTETTVFKDQHIKTFIQAMIPPSYRKTDVYTNMLEATRKKVLKLCIEFYPQFDEKYKEDAELYSSYKRLILNNIYAIIRDKKLDSIDDKLKRDDDFVEALRNLGQGEDYDKLVKTLKAKPSLFLTLSEELRNDENIQELYLRSRCIDSSTPWRQFFVKEWMDPRMPNSLKQRQDARDKYKEYVLWSINKVGLTNSPYYLSCTEKDIDADFIDDPDIQKACDDRKSKTKKSYGWYYKVVLS